MRETITPRKWLRQILSREFFQNCLRNWPCDDPFFPGDISGRPCGLEKKVRVEKTLLLDVVARSEDNYEQSDGSSRTSYQPVG